MSRKRRKRSPDPPRTPPAGGPAAGTPAPIPTPGRRWLFRTVLLLIPFAAVLLSELALRASGYGTPLEFVLRRDVEGQPRLLSNPRFSWLFFEPSQARVPPPFSLPVHKPAGTVRVFVLGSSAAQGDPEPAFGIARQLEVLLRDQYPGEEIEVVNAAVTAVNSHYVYAAARAALELEPDVLVVYEGNNEVVGPFGAGTVFTASAPPLPLVRAAVAARRTRLGQLVGSAARAAAAGLGRSSRAPGAWHGMKMFLEQQVRAGDPALERAYRNFEGNLAGVCRMARRAGVPVVLSTVAVNLASCGPFASAEAVELYRSGREESSRGEDGKARRLLERARDLDTLRFRADGRVNAIVRAVASREAARLVDAEELLAREAPRGAPGDESFLDHVHLSFHGNYLVAAALLDAVRDALPEPVRRRASSSPPPGEAEVARRLVFTDLDRYNIAETMQQRLREPPFTNQPDHAEHEKRFADEMALLRARGDAGGVEAAVAEYERALAAPSPHWSLRERYAGIERRLRRPGVAAEQLERLTRQFPQQPGFELLLSRALRDAGRFVEARTSLQKVLDYQPDAPVTLVELAQLELAQGRPLEARAAAGRAVGLDPFDANALNVLAASLCPGLRCGPAERKEAIDLITRALEIAPESEELKRGLQALRGGSPGGLTGQKETAGAASRQRPPSPKDRSARY